MGPTCSRGLARLVGLALGLVLAALVPPPSGEAQPTIALELVASGPELARPVDITHARDGSGRLFVILQSGQIRIIRGGQVLPAPFLDIGSLVTFPGGSGESGLLGLVFHPNYPTNDLFYVRYTDLAGDVIIARYRVSSDPDVADPTSGVILLTIPHDQGDNHNGAQIQFGPDGFLYVGVGDGGGAGDPEDDAQNLGSLLGKLLRLDVDGGFPYAIPPGNPFVGTPGARGEIWAYGLRNPWRLSFDRATGDLFIGDAGQSDREELDYQPAGSPGGQNYGWHRMEGTLCFDPPVNCNDGTLTLPILDFDNVTGDCAITAGYRYRGARFPSLYGMFVFGDFCSGRIRGATPNPDGTWTATVLLETGFLVSALGEDQAGELYVGEFTFDGNGAVHRILVPGDMPARRLTVSPSSGAYVLSQAFDLVLVEEAPVATVTGRRAVLDGADVTGLLNACLVLGTLSTGGVTSRCPGVTGALLGPGTHTLSVTLDFADGSTATDVVTWEVRTGADPQTLTISPPSGAYAATQRFDLMLIVGAASAPVVGGSATLGGADVTGALAGCLSPGTLAAGGLTLRCPGLTGGFLGLGSHTLTITLTFDDGSSAADTVIWRVLGNTEPDRRRSHMLDTARLAGHRHL